MQGKYDTLDSVELTQTTTLHDVYTWVLGLPMAQADVCGILITGPINMGQPQGGTWGRFARFQGHDEVWGVRSAPVGRLGQPIALGEVRQVAVIVRESERSTRARVTVIKLWRLPSDTMVPMPVQDERRRARGRRTHGASGVAVHGVNLFEDIDKPGASFFAVRGTHTVLSAITTIHNEATSALCKVETAMNPRYILAGAIAGFVVPDAPTVRRCEEQYTEGAWDQAVENNESAFARLLEDVGFPSEADMASRLLFTAEDLFEQCSFVGYLDMLADPFYDGALPDAAHQPSGIALMMAIAVHVATNPARWGLPAARPEDAYAAKEVAFLVECVMPSLMATGSDGVSGVQTFGVDLVINRALEAIRSLIHKMQSGQADGARVGVDHRRLSQVVKETMLFLYCTGVALCQDVCGLVPQHADGSSGLYTSTGLAQPLADPMLESRTQSAYAANLGRVVARWPTIRTSSRGKRQLALTAVLVSVDRWLRTRTYKGVVLSQTAQAPHSVLPQDLDPAAPAAAAAAAAAAASERAAPTPRSAKKKKKQQFPEAALAERGRLRDAHGQYCANQVVAPLFGDKRDPRLMECCAKLSGEAIDQAAGIFADVLQWGGCAGIGQLFEVTSYMVGTKSALRCANCNQFVNVVQSVAFAGALGTCHRCKHPRCLACVTKDLAATQSAKGGTRPDAAETCRICTKRKDEANA